MKKINKMWIFMIMMTFVLNLFSGILTYANLNAWDPIRSHWNDDSTPVVSGNNVEEISQWSNSFSERLKWIVYLPEPWNYSTSLWYAIALIQLLVNRILWMLAFIALIYMLYCGFLVLSAWSDDGNAGKGKKWISNAAIALAWIWLSWLIVSVIIWFIRLVADY